MATEINLTKTSKDKAERIAMRLRGQTSMNFYVNVCPCNGSFLVNVGTLRAGRDGFYDWGVTDAHLDEPQSASLGLFG